MNDAKLGKIWDEEPLVVLVGVGTAPSSQSSGGVSGRTSRNTGLGITTREQKKKSILAIPKIADIAVAPDYDAKTLEWKMTPNAADNDRQRRQHVRGLWRASWTRQKVSKKFLERLFSRGPSLGSQSSYRRGELGAVIRLGGEKHESASVGYSSPTRKKSTKGISIAQSTKRRLGRPDLEHRR
ncbi:1438_t:CDS:2 [Acaulospora colombiana]|uniref:1438_t:CDS:1 n=1 Tax=Acaulospora colombiana TaxID=27376 RepID=A0ACA9NJP6_9GLOM|nr:1438_t:CDS:2 [Acaulospora colombiana]